MLGATYTRGIPPILWGEIATLTGRLCRNADAIVKLLQENPPEGCVWRTDGKDIYSKYTYNAGIPVDVRISFLTAKSTDGTGRDTILMQVYSLTHIISILRIKANSTQTLGDPDPDGIHEQQLQTGHSNSGVSDYQAFDMLQSTEPAIKVVESQAAKQ